MKAILLALLFVPVSAGAQMIYKKSERPDTVLQHRLPKHPVRNGCWLLPANVHRINGLALGIWCMNIHNKDLRINGLNIDLLPLGAFLAPYVLLGAPYDAIRRPDSASLADTLLRPDGNYYGDFYTAVSGVDLRLTGGLPVDRVDGISVNGLINNCGRQAGVAISGIYNDARDLRGVQIAGVANFAKRGKGLQIGLFNKAVDCSCFQIGLLNRNGRSLLPLVNWRHHRHQVPNRKRPLNQRALRKSKSL